jgi:hypothetical protein
MQFLNKYLELEALLLGLTVGVTAAGIAWMAGLL